MWDAEALIDENRVTVACLFRAHRIRYWRLGAGVTSAVHGPVSAGETA